jgi:hypothetical protein
VFINATPERLCGLYISFDTEIDYGDNWLPVGGLPVGKELEVKVKPGTYKAKWNSCKDVSDRPTTSYAATLVAGTAFQVSEPLQLYAFVSDGVAPTKRGVPRPKLKMIKFIGQPTEIAATLPPSPAETPPGETPPEAPPAETGPPKPTRPIVGPLPTAPWSLRPVAPPPVAAHPPAAPPVAPPAPPVAHPPAAPPAAPPPTLGPPGSPVFAPK